MENPETIGCDVDIDILDREQLVELAKKLQRTIKRSQTFESATSCSSCNRQSNQHPSKAVWIRAEADDPYDRDGSKGPTVLAYDQTMLNIDVRNRHEFNEKEYVIYAKLTSRFKSRIFVFRENFALSNGNSKRRFRVSTREETPKGFVNYCEIPLNRLKLKPRLKIWLGKVEWLFILPDPDSRQSSFNPEKASDAR